MDLTGVAEERVGLVSGRLTATSIRRIRPGLRRLRRRSLRHRSRLRVAVGGVRGLVAFFCGVRAADVVGCADVVAGGVTFVQDQAVEGGVVDGGVRLSIVVDRRGGDEDTSEEGEEAQYVHFHGV